MEKKMIVCVSGGMIQTIRSNFECPDVEVEIWDEDCEDFLREQFDVPEHASLDAHWESIIVNDFPHVVH